MLNLGLYEAVDQTCRKESLNLEFTLLRRESNGLPGFLKLVPIDPNISQDGDHRPKCSIRCENDLHWKVERLYIDEVPQTRYGTFGRRYI